MTRLGRPSNLTDFRAVLATTGELEIGAHARRMRRRRALTTLVGLTLLSAAGALGWVLWPRDSSAGREGYPAEVRCITCKFSGTVRVRPTDVFPVTCPQCKERSCHQVWQCRKCAAKFVLDKWLTDDGRRRPLACPECKSQNVGSAAAPP